MKQCKETYIIAKLHVFIIDLFALLPLLSHHFLEVHAISLEHAKGMKYASGRLRDFPLLPQVTYEDPLMLSLQSRVCDSLNLAL